ncbi:gamma-glutamylcyclotransferase family protein [Methanobrevibacter sp.]
MNMIKLKKQKHNEPEFDELYKMISDLEGFFEEDVDLNDKEYDENMNVILDFQDLDGSFKLFDSYKIPSDAKIDFIYMPTYICTAILMKAYLADTSGFGLKHKAGLLNGLKMSCTKNLWGHGFEGLKGQIKALNIFMKAGLKEFIDIHPGFCPEFTHMIANIASKYQKMENEGKVYGLWGESYESDIHSINEYLCQRLVFVYGTLMNGQANHGFLENSEFLGNAAVEGYDMYDVGWYPAIVPGDGVIHGELYRVSTDAMPSIDSLEGEGTLYAKKYENVVYGNGKTARALVYVYLEDVSGLQKIPAWKGKYVWYVSYGSNMLEERFLRYIKGGSYGASRKHPPCEDTSSPIDVRAFEIPYDMYFGNISGSWSGSGVSFLDVTKDGSALGVAYLITRKQFEHIAARENGGREPSPDGAWYEDIIDLGEMDGIEVKTITNRNLRPYNEPVLEYLGVLFKGIRQNWPEMSDAEIEDYLTSCIR